MLRWLRRRRNRCMICHLSPRRFLLSGMWLCTFCHGSVVDELEFWGWGVDAEVLHGQG